MRRLFSSSGASGGSYGRRRVVVTGIGIVSPLGNTLEDSWRQITGDSDTNNNNNNTNNDNCGVTTLEETLLSHQDLSGDQFDREWKIARSLPCQVAAPVRGLHEAFLTEDTNTDGTRNPRTTARFVQMALLAGSEAMKQANLIDWLNNHNNNNNNNNEEETNSNNNNYNHNHDRRRDRFGVSVGSGMSSVREISTAWDTITNNNSIRKLSPHFIPKVLANSAAGRLSLEHGLRGPNLAPSTACAASAHAIGDAFRLIRTGASDVMLAGGAEASIEPLGLAGFCRLRALSTSFNDTPKDASRPFDAQRDGFVMGEGAAILVLEELEHARERIRQEQQEQQQADTTRTTTKPKTTTRILAEITGYAATGDAFHVTAPDEAGWGAEEAMLRALEEDRLLCHNPFLLDIDIPVPSIGYINAHATSTPKGDQIEADVVDRVLRSQRKNHEAHPSSVAAEAACCYMSSTKGMSGHLLGAAGALEAAFTIMSLVDQKIPPTLNLHLNDGDGAVDGKEGNIDGPLFTHVAGNRALEPTSDIQMAVSNSFGFGGTNASLVFRRYNGDTGTGEKINT